MSNFDAEITELVVVLTGDYAERLAEAVAMLKGAGMRIRRADDDNSVVEGDIDTQKLPQLRKLPCVEYIRQIFSYVADFPPGDRRDHDGANQTHTDPEFAD